MVWGDFIEGRNTVLGESLLRYQKRLVGMIAGRGGKYHADPLFAEQGMIKIGDMYKQQLRVYAWRYWRGRLPSSQTGMLGKVEDVHTYNTRSARAGLFISSRDHRSLGYRVPREWDTLPEEHREIRSQNGFKRKSKEGFLAGYRSFRCLNKKCYICETRGVEDYLNNVVQ